MSGNGTARTTEVSQVQGFPCGMSEVLCTLCGFVYTRGRLLLLQVQSAWHRARWHDQHHLVSLDTPIPKEAIKECDNARR